MIADFVSRFARGPGDVRQSLDIRAALEKRGAALWRARASSSAGVLSLGPSSKVSAIARRSRGPRQIEGANIAEDRPRTAQAAPATAAAPAMDAATLLNMGCS